MKIIALILKEIIGGMPTFNLSSFGRWRIKLHPTKTFTARYRWF